MQHHDAITGTHMDRVGIDYKKMMVDTRKNALNSTQRGSLISSQVQLMAKNEGISVNEINDCNIDGQSVVCNDLLDSKDI